MKSRFFLFLFFLISYFTCLGQIHYGSNNGKYLRIRGKNIYYEEYGKGAPLILLEGGMGTIADFALCIPELSKHYRIIAPDAPGLGNSEFTDSVSYLLLADFISGLIDSLKLDSAYVIGWSDGGNVALILASNRSDKVKKVVASGANYKLSGFIFSDTNALNPVPEDFRVSSDMQQWIDGYFKANKMHWKKIMNDRIKMWSQEIYFSPVLLEQIKIPVLLVAGDHDAVTLEHATEMHRLIRGSQFCVLPNTSHAVFSERPELISKIALNFFAGK